MSKYYGLREDGSVYELSGVLEWAKLFETKDRTVARAEIDGSLVSTVFLGLDHNYYRSGPPILFETLVFRGPLDGEMERYSTIEEARKGHEAMCQRVRQKLRDDGLV